MTSAEKKAHDDEENEAAARKAQAVADEEVPKAGRAGHVPTKVLEEEEKPAHETSKDGGKSHWPKGFKPSGNSTTDTRALLEQGEQIMFIVPLAQGESPGAKDFVMINGVEWSVKKGVQVKIPVAVANLLANKYAVELAVWNRTLEAAGQKTKDALDV